MNFELVLWVMGVVKNIVKDINGLSPDWGGKPVLVLAQVSKWGHSDLVRSTMSLNFFTCQVRPSTSFADMVGFWPLKTCGYLSPFYVSLNCIHLFVYIQVFLGDIVGSIPDHVKQRMQQSKHHNKVNTVIKQVKHFLISHCI